MINARRSNPMGVKLAPNAKRCPRGRYSSIQATALTLMLGPNGSVGIQASLDSHRTQ